MADNTNIEIIYNSLTSDLQQRPRKGVRSPSQVSQSRSQSRFQPALDEDIVDVDSYHYRDDEQSDTTQTYVTHSTSEHSSSNEAAPLHQREKELFQKARQYLNPGRFFRLVTFLFAERKLLTFFWVHAIATLVVWGTYI